jgi:hypothetical protein
MNFNGGANLPMPAKSFPRLGCGRLQATSCPVVCDFLCEPASGWEFVQINPI